MKTHSEVNFEKRGKLEDHQTCPVCGACVCDGHNHAKLRTIFTTILFLLLLPTLSLAQTTVPYDFETLDISIPGEPGLAALPVDLNDKGNVLSNIVGTDLIQKALVIQHPGKRRQKLRQAFSCSDKPSAFPELGFTIGESLSNRNAVVGTCSDETGRQFAFFKRPRQLNLLFNFPGADSTVANGVSDNGHITGQFISPIIDNGKTSLSYRFHCYTVIAGQFTRIDFPVPNTFVDCRAITPAGRVLGEYRTVNDQTNEILDAGWFIYDNGNFFTSDFALPQSGPAFLLTDMNRNDQILIQRFNGDEEWNGIVLYDDGKFYKINGFPEDWILVGVEGMNNEAEFVGSYLIPNGDKFEIHGFKATPGKHYAKK